MGRTYSWSKLPDWALRVDKIMDTVVQQATNDLLRGIKIVPGINRGGSRVRGTLPRDIGALVSSLQSTLLGSTALSGEASWTMVVGQMRAGDVAQFSWGGFAAPHARHVHDGANGVPGTFWIDVAAGKWPSIVAAVVVRVRAELA